MSDWPVLPLRRAFRVVNGGTPTPDEANWGGDVPWATPVDLGASAGVVIKTQRSLTLLGAQTGSRVVPANSILLSTRAPIGHVARAGVRMAFNQGCRALVPSMEVDSRFFAYQLTAMTDELRMRGQGTTFIELSGDSLASVPIAVPPLGEQRCVADFLDREVSGIDELIARKRHMLSLLDERELAAVTHSFGTEVHSRSDGVPVRIGDASAPPLGRVAVIQSGLTLDAARDAGDYPITLPYLRVANVQDGRLDLAELKEVTVSRAIVARCRLRTGDVLMTEGGDPDKLGRGAVWSGVIEPCLHQNHVFAVRPDTSKLLPEYLAALSRTSYARTYFEMTASKTTGIASTSTSKIAAFRVPLPSITEQRSLVQQIVTVNNRFNAVHSRLVTQIGLLQERRLALITAAVTGQLDIPGVAA